MTDRTTILVPIRFPLTDQSSRTLAFAGQLAREHAPAELLVLHVNLFQVGERARKADIVDAVAPLLDGVDASVSVRRGLLVEEVILEEATRSNADVIVLGKSQKVAWRRFLSRMAGNDPAVASFLRENLNGQVEVVEAESLSAAAVVGGGE